MQSRHFNQPITIGKAIGILRAERGKGPEALREQLSPEDRQYLAQVEERLNMLLDSPEEIKQLFEKLPAGACRTDKTYLKTHQAILLAFFFCEEQLRDCNHFSNHLNNCFQCLSAFAEILSESSVMVRK